MSEKSPAAKAASPAEETVAVFHRGGGHFIHGEHTLAPGELKHVPKSVAELWLSHGTPTHRPVVLAKDMGSKAVAAPEVAKLKEAEALVAEQDEKIKNLEKLLQQLREGTGAPQGGSMPFVPQVPPPEPKAAKGKKSDS